MGRLANAAQERCEWELQIADHTFSTNMLGVVAISDPNSNKYLQIDRSFVKHGVHVEHLLLQALSAATENFKAIPNNATVMLFGRWSPCIECTQQVPHAFFSHENIRNRTIRLKMRFFGYYATGSYPYPVDPAKVWASAAAAQLAYDARENDFPLNEGWRAEPRLTPLGEETAVMVRRRWTKLVIQPFNVAKTSRILEERAI